MNNDLIQHNIDLPHESAAEQHNEEGVQEVSPLSCENVPDDSDTSFITVKPYHERYYLLYNNKERADFLAPEETNAFLKSIGFDGGELKQARLGKNYSNQLTGICKQTINQLKCSYCGCDITGVEFYRLPDGRVRCTSCSNSIVKTKEEVKDIFTRVLANLDSFFGAAVNVPITIEVLDEIRLKKKIGSPLGEMDDQSLLILGVAVNKNKKYSMIIENGAPRISLIATFAHELTHIWQYMHWDNKKGFKKCSGDKRLLIYEGMAKWVEIQYLYFIGETNIARREEAFTRNRQDEYGLGFCIYESYYPLSRETMKCDATPFITDRYPFD